MFQLLAPAILKILLQDVYFQEIDQNLLIAKENVLWYYTYTKNYHSYLFSQINDATNAHQIFIEKS